MQQPTVTVYPVSDILQWHESGQLEIQPKFQRRDIWVPKAKSYLVDTILRGMPIPPIFMRLSVNPSTRRTVRQVIDGQQRLRATLGFIRGDFTVLKVHYPEFGGMTYADLPDNAQSAFLSYKFVVHQLENISDTEVLSLFARMNTYTVRLNSQELRNAEYFGYFKTTIYQLANDHYAFWKNHNILNDAAIARMGDSELVSELVVCMLSGIRQTKDEDLRSFYKQYDDEFAERDQVCREFNQVMDTIGNVIGDRLRSSEFRRIPLFFSLFLAFYDAQFGLPNSQYPRAKFTPSDSKRITENAAKLDTLIRMEKTPSDWVPFVQAAQRGTADPGKRRLRHDVLWHELFGYTKP